MGRKRRELSIAATEKLENSVGSAYLVPLLAPAVIAAFPPEVEEQYHANTGLRKSTIYSDVAANFVDLFCRRCYKYDCKTHAIKQPTPNERKDPQPPPPGVVCPEVSSKRPLLRASVEEATPAKRGRVGRGLVDKLSFYSEVVGQELPFNMYDAQGVSTKRAVMSVRSGKTGGASQTKAPAILLRRPSLTSTPAECAIALKLHNILMSSRHIVSMEETSDMIPTASSLKTLEESIDVAVAALLGTCLPVHVSEMYTLAQKEIGDAEDSVGVGSPSRPGQVRLNRQDPSNSKGSKKKAAESGPSTIGINKQALHKIRSTAASSMREAHQPCNHKGPCVYGVCRCFENGYCEVTCACWGSGCDLQFQGCKCKIGQCRTRSCGCVAADRECDPNLCLSCGVSVHPALKTLFTCGECKPNQGNLGNGATANISDTKCCSNANMLLGMGKKVSVGRSSIHGWGAFIRESAQKGDFIMEYRGEMVSQNEADRRGKRFDKVDSTFLFNLCEEVCIDATRKGSKAKFANHSFTPNCYSRIRMVRGDYRIGIYAQRALRAGEEITFNYDMRVSDEDAPGWCVTMQTSSSQRNNDFLVRK